MDIQEFYKDFIKWAESVIGKTTDQKGLPLRVLFFMDGEPYIGTYPNLNYNTYLNRKLLLTK